MAETTEIYICRGGQSLDEGRLEYSNFVETREEAEADAVQRCKFDPSVTKVAYYAVTESGEFRNLFTYHNPNPVVRGRKSAASGGIAPPARPARKVRRAVKLPMWRRMVNFFHQ